MKNNYMFRTKSVFVRQFLEGWFILITSTLLFAVIAAGISQFNIRPDFTVGITFLLMLPVVFGAHYYLYVRNMRSVLQSDAIHVLNQYDSNVVQLRRLRDRALSTHAETVVWRKDMKRRYTKLINYRRVASECGRHDLVEDIDNLQGRIKVFNLNAESLSEKALNVRDEIDALLRSGEQNVSLARVRAVALPLDVLAAQERQRQFIQEQFRQVGKQLNMS